ncbi:DUF5777 family beta-barrel protein [Cesiribacter sp. SM1]|uniref:DUF5777 family beta-barrel protein n=1 Tax=Cesiribacter sp. SM1 TaxID=2861196 RepID=UPI001CD4A4EF|nr:DUF5777 family beta-barrel protein [Cesiribacter sp. SM1]
MKRNSWQQRIFMLLFTLLFTLSAAHSLQAQDELLDALREQQDPAQPEYTTATFKSTRLINGHTIETRSQGVLDFIISHRFGRLNSGAYNLFGLDEANIRLGLDYGLTNRLNIGFGRSSFERVYDGFIKYKLLQQGNGKGTAPLSAVLFSSAAIGTLKSANELSLSNRLTYTWQLLLARKFSERLSLQLMPAVVHRNLSLTEEDSNDIYALGAGGRYKLNKRLALNFEYYYRFNEPLLQPNYNALAIGLDIETGGHVFQLHLTNARAMQERGFITQTTGNFFDGDIHFGFNVSRVFQLRSNNQVTP